MHELIILSITMRALNCIKSPSPREESRKQVVGWLLQCSVYITQAHLSKTEQEEGSHGNYQTQVHEAGQGSQDIDEQIFFRRHGSPLVSFGRWVGRHRR